MPSERRFDESEVAAIFERATAREAHGEARGDAPGHQLIRGGDGLTLGQLQEIGREIGIAPDVIADAALTLGQREQVTTRRVLGLPMGVAQTVPLQRRLSDEEWERLVVTLREVFDARGVTRQDGSLREWRNGNLQALLEPTEDGQRVRLRTFKGNAPGAMLGGLVITGAAWTGLTAAVLNGATGDLGMLTALSAMGTAGLAMVGVTAWRLFPWARRRREQMAEIAARIAALQRTRQAEIGPGTPPPEA